MFILCFNGCNDCSNNAGAAATQARSRGCSHTSQQEEEQVQAQELQTQPLQTQQLQAQELQTQPLQTQQLQA